MPSTEEIFLEYLLEVAFAHEFQENPSRVQSVVSLKHMYCDNDLIDYRMGLMTCVPYKNAKHMLQIP